MNAKARRLGMGNSYFVNAHGLTEDGQFSTARDMAKLAFVTYRDQRIRQAVSTRELEFSHQGWTEKLKNTNRLLHGLPFVTGMKTGFTNAAGRCLVASASYEGREVISVVLGSSSKHVWDDAEKLLRWALRISADEPVPVEGETSKEDNKTTKADSNGAS